MKRIVRSTAICLLMLLCLASVMWAKDKRLKSGPLAGTWECMSHGGPHGDMSFTLYLDQTKEIVTGSVSSPIGSTELTSATFKKHVLEIHIDTPEGNYLLTATYKNGQLTGNWARDTDLKGTWECKRSASAQP